MSRLDRLRAPATRSMTLALAQLGTGLVAGAGVASALLLGSPAGPTWVLLLFPATALVYGAAGLSAWSRRPSNRMGPIMVLGAYVWLAASLINTTVPLLVAVGTVVATIPIAVVIHLLHAFPSGRLRGRTSRVCVVAAYVICGVFQAPIYLFGTSEHPYDLLLLTSRPQLAELADDVQSGLFVVVTAVTAIVVLARYAASDRARRRVAGPLMVFGLLIIVFVVFAGSVLEPVFGMDALTRAVLQIVSLAGVPVAFAVGMVRGGFRRTGAVAELESWVGAAQLSRASLVDALAETLGDPSVELVFWAPEAGRYLAADGTPAVLPRPDRGRRLVEIDLAGRRVGAVIYDADLLADQPLVERAGRVVAIAVDHERMTAELRAQEDAVRRSRERIVEAGDAERRRIARDLHDGIQANLVLLALQAYAIGEGDQHEVPERATALREGIDRTAAELRHLVHGMLPALLVERGLFAAASDLVDRLPMAASIELVGDDAGLPLPVQTTTYFALSEALTNVVKHARARRVTVRVARERTELRIEVADDGIGGAHHGAGSGLRGLEDRLDVLHGRWRLHSPPGGGTRLEVVLPCGS